MLNYGLRHDNLSKEWKFKKNKERHKKAKENKDEDW